MKMILGNKTNKTAEKIHKADVSSALQTEKTVAAGSANPAKSVSRKFLFEDTARRDEYAKHYVGNDGTITAVYGNRAVHYKAEDGQLKEIDNCLEAQDGALKRKSGGFDAKFFGADCGGKLFEVQKGRCKVVLSSADVRGRSAAEFVCERNNEKSSSVVWKNAKENTDLQYIVDADRVKENIIVKEKAETYEYSFELDAENLTVGVSDDGKILQLKDKDSGEVKFYIPSPIMSDAAGKRSDLVYYELEEEADDRLQLKVVADEEWINAEERVFPVKIDPQIVSSDTSVLQYKYYEMGEIEHSSGLIQFWEEMEMSSVNMFSIDSTHKFEVMIDKSKLELAQFPYNRINSAKFNIQSERGGNCYVNGESYSLGWGTVLQLDVTSLLNDAGPNDVVKLEFTANGGPGATFSLDGSDNPPQLFIEYSKNEIEAEKKNFSLAGGTTGALDVATGECAVYFSDLSTGGSVLPLQISHVHKQNETDFSCGADWRLNLHQKLEKSGENYTYTDASGWKHSFEEVYYYVKDGERCVVDEADVTVEQDGKLTCIVDGNTYDVTREMQTNNGMRLVTRLDGGKNLQYIEQREDEEKQAEEYIESYKTTLEDLRIVNQDTGSELATTLDLDSSDPDPDGFFNYSSDDYIILSRSEVIQYKNWVEDIAAYWQTYNSIAENESDKEKQAERASAKKEAERLEEQLALLKSNAESKRKQAQKVYKEYLIKLQEQKVLKRALPVAYLTDDSGTILCFNENGDLCAIMDRYENYIAVEWDEITASSIKKLAITSVYEGERVTSFRYNRAGQLSSITSSDGKRVEYTYNEATWYGTLKKVKFPDGSILRFEYASNGEILSVRSSAEQSQTLLEYASNGYSLTKVTNQSLVSAVTAQSVAGQESDLDNHATGTGQSISVYNMTYEDDYTTIEKDGSKEYVLLDDERKAYGSYRKTQGKIDDFGIALYIPRNFSFKVTPKKTSDIIGSVSTVDNIIKQRLSFSFPGISSLPDMTGEYSTFAEADWEDTTLDSFNRPQKTTTNWKRIGTSSENKAVYACTETVYAYAAEDPAYPCLQKTTTTYVNLDGAKSTVSAEKTVYVEKYSYCEHGNLVKTESYVEGEEGTSGVNVTEKVCDDKGNIVKEFSYNTLDSGTKFYTESDYAEDGKESAVYDETGENKTVLEYADGTTTVKTQVLPNGSKFSYGHDASGRVTAITQSTKEGEGNQTTKKYNLNCVTHLTSGKNVVQYEYDHKRRVKKVSVNGTETAYAYAGSAYDDTESVTYEGKAADKVTVTRGTVVSERYTDKRGNALGAVVDGETQYKNTYTADDNLQKSVDHRTNSETAYTYATDGTKRLTQVSVSAGTNVNALTETYTYNDYGQTATKSLSEAVSQTYVYAYKDNAARDPDYMTLPNGLQYHPQKDVNGRNTGRELTDTNGNRKYGEYIYYRKVGDHATNMPASVYYGMTKNGKYVIGENVKYSYDAMGNISKVFENGTMTVQYTYDALNRLVREDNKKLGKTYFTTYDNCGNILSKRTTAYTLKAEEELSEETFTEVLYGYEANSDRLISYNGGAITYDEFGNPTDYRGNTLEWRYGKFLEKYGSTTFAYDGYGRRIKKGNTVFTYDNEGNLVKQSDGTNTLEFIYDGNGLCGVKCNTVNYLYRKNAQGDITHILDNAGMVVAKYVYDAWGNHAILDANGNDLASGVGVLNPFRYRSYYYDEETDLYYLQTRYYDPEVGRFISQDDVSYLAPDSINGLNLYAYCSDNPVMYTDETGCSILLTLLFGFLIGFVISGVVEIGKQVQTYGWDVFQWDWKQIGLSALGGGVSGLISAIPLGGFVGAFFFGGVGAVVGGFISGSVTDIESGIKAFVIGGVANLIGYGVAKGIENLKVNNIMKLSSKAKSANIWKLKGVDPSSLLKKTRYIFKDYTRKQVAEVVRETNKWLQYNIQSSFVSSSLSSLGGLI